MLPVVASMLCDAKVSDRKRNCGGGGGDGVSVSEYYELERVDVPGLAATKVVIKPYIIRFE